MYVAFVCFARAYGHCALLADLLTNHWEWTFAVLNMVKLCLILTLYAHWQACLWGLVSSYMEQEGYPNWITSFDAQHVATFGGQPHPLDRYVAAMYWSTMTLTSIGYGEFTPVNTAERALCSVYMMVSGVLWTYAIGSVAAIATTLVKQACADALPPPTAPSPLIVHITSQASRLGPWPRGAQDPNHVLYQNTMDQLNYFMRERGLPRRMRITLRDVRAESQTPHARRIPCLSYTPPLGCDCPPPLRSQYFSAARRVHQLSDDSDLLNKMSPLLQGTVALAANYKWLEKVWYFRGLEGTDGSSDFVAALAKQLVIRSYITHERLPIGQLYILRRGLVVKARLPCQSALLCVVSPPCRKLCTEPRGSSRISHDACAARVCRQVYSIARSHSSLG